MEILLKLNDADDYKKHVRNDLIEHVREATLEVSDDFTMDVDGKRVFAHAFLDNG